VLELATGATPLTADLMLELAAGAAPLAADLVAAGERHGPAPTGA